MANDNRMTGWKTAPPRHVEAAGTRFAYRRLGPDTGVPVVPLNHWAADRPVYAFDYRGIGTSGGKLDTLPTNW